MNSGKMRHRIQLQSKDVTRDAFGAESITWETKREVWAQISPMSAREYFQSQQMQSKATHKITIRYYPSITTEWRIKLGSRLFNIQSIINPDELNKEQIMICTEFVT